MNKHENTEIYSEQNSSWKQGYKNGYNVGMQTACVLFITLLKGI